MGFEQHYTAQPYSTPQFNSVGQPAASSSYAQQQQYNAVGQPIVSDSHVQASVLAQAQSDDNLAEEIDTLSVQELKERLRARGLQVSGRKALLQHRLRCYINQEDVPFDESTLPPTSKGKRKAVDDDDYAPGLDEPSSSVPKKSQKLASGEQVVVERRSKPWRGHAPKAITERLQRALTQRFFLVERNRQGAELKEEFKIFGSTGSIYTVTVSNVPTCTCPDARKGNFCKHICFVFVRVLGRDTRSDNLWYQAALLTSELAQIFNEARPAPNDPTTERVKKAYERATGKTSAEDEAAPAPKKELDDDSDCAICYETMTTKDQLWWCSVCSNALHQGCFREWTSAARTTGKQITCPTCRTEVKEASAAGGKAGGSGKIVGGYLNLAEETGIGRARDTSTYYQGPRRGMPAWQAEAIARSYGRDDEDDFEDYGGYGGGYGGGHGGYGRGGRNRYGYY